MSGPSPELLAFLGGWLAWAENGAPCGYPYYRSDGLCDNAYRVHGREVFNLMDACFDTEFPFGVDEYQERADEGTQHLCPKRLAWVKETLAKATGQ